MKRSIKNKLIKKIVDGNLFNKLINIYRVNGILKLYSYLKKINVSNIERANAYTALSKYLRNKKEFKNAYKLASIAYKKDPRLYRKKFLAFRMADVGKYTEALIILKSLNKSVYFSSNEIKKKKLLIHLNSINLKDNILSHLNYREYIKNKTNTPRLDCVNSIIDINLKNDLQWPLITIILSSKRNYNIKNIYDNLKVQNYPNIEIIFGLNGFNYKDKSLLKSLENNINISKCIFFNIPDDVSLGSKYNYLIKYAKGLYIAKMDDDDIYMKNYLWDLSLPFKFTNCDIIGKKTYYCYLKDEKKSLLKFPDNEHKNTNFIAGATFIFKRNVWNKIKFDDIKLGEDTSFLKKIIKNKLSVYSSDSLNYICIRYNDLSKHTFKNFRYDSQELKNESYLELYKKLDV